MRSMFRRMVIFSKGDTGEIVCAYCTDLFHVILRYSNCARFRVLFAETMAGNEHGISSFEEGTEGTLAALMETNYLA